MIDLDGLAAEIYASNVARGWWDEWPNRHDRHETGMMLVVSELSEAMEGFRKDLWDDHLPHHKMLAVELADAMIRLLDLAGAYELTNLDRAPYSYMRPLPTGHTVPEQLYWIVQTATDMRFSNSLSVSRGIAAVMAVTKLNDVDLWPIVAEKRAYNAKRADHQFAARTATNGKKF